MANFDNKNNSIRTSAYNQAVTITGTVTEAGIIVDAADAKELTFQMIIDTDGTGEMDLLSGIFEHSDDDNPANFSAIPVKNLIGDANDFAVNLDFQEICYTATMGAFNTKRYVRTGFTYERGAVGGPPGYWGIVKQVKLIPTSLGG